MVLILVKIVLTHQHHFLCSYIPYNVDRDGLWMLQELVEAGEELDLGQTDDLSGRVSIWEDQASFEAIMQNWPDVIEFLIIHGANLLTRVTD